MRHVQHQMTDSFQAHKDDTAIREQSKPLTLRPYHLKRKPETSDNSGFELPGLPSCTYAERSVCSTTMVRDAHLMKTGATRRPTLFEYDKRETRSVCSAKMGTSRPDS